MLVNGAVAGQQMMDKMTVDTAGNIWLQEDVGNQPHLGKIWKHEPATGILTLVAEHDASRFIAGASADIDGSGSRQSDEESSGIVDVTARFRGDDSYDTENYQYFLLDVQAHTTVASAA